MYLVGPSAISSAHGGYTYFQSGFEVATRLSFVNLLKKKSEALDKSKQAFCHLENESGIKLWSMRNDRGGECVSAEWKSYLQSKDIIHGSSK